MYETYFGLNAKPFQLNPDPAFFYGSRGHRRAMAYLEYGLHQNEGFIVITGDVGAGKTTLVRNVLEHLDPKKVLAAHLVSTQVDAEDILRLVATAFGLPTRNQDKAGLLLALETFLVSTAAAGKRALLIVDEAQNLSPRAVEELRMLSNFQLEEHALLQSFLIGQPEFRDMMQSPGMQQLRQRVIASYHLGPLDATETRAYIEHRLKHAGWHNDPAFAPGAFDLIHAHTGGVPRRINTLCDRLMLAAYLSDRHALGEAEVQEVVEELKDEFATPMGGAVQAQAAANGHGSNGNNCGAATVGAGAGLPLGFDPNNIDLGRLQVPHGMTERVSSMAASYDARRLEVRLARLEQSMSATLNVLSELLEAIRRAPREGGEGNER